MDNEIARKKDITATLFLLVQNRQQRHDWTLIGSGANGLGIQDIVPSTLHIFLWAKDVFNCGLFDLSIPGPTVMFGCKL